MCEVLPPKLPPTSALLPPGRRPRWEPPLDSHQHWICQVDRTSHNLHPILAIIGTGASLLPTPVITSKTLHTHSPQQ